MTLDLPRSGRPAAELELAPAEFDELADAEGWTDGLPVVPPTPERVEAALGAAAGDRLDVLGVMPPGGGVVTLEAVAVNAVMAGCRPALFPVLLAAVRAVLRPEFNLYGVQATTNPVTPAL